MTRMQTQTIRFMSFNIQHGLDFVKRVVDLDLMVKTIRDCKADIVGLNEVYSKTEKFGSQDVEIAKKLDYHNFFGFAEMIDGTMPYGSALVSRLPIQSAEIIEIPGGERERHTYERRSIIKAEFENPSFTLLISHFGLHKKDHEEASATVCRLVDEATKPVVLMGDFNMTPDNPLMQPIFSRLNNTLDTSHLSFPSVNPKIRIDYIFASPGIKVVHAEIPQIVASDHFPHIAELQFGG
jgi:endonuclease/exonuclease/phosphatase family metal-dependent hydrolase